MDLKLFTDDEAPLDVHVDWYPPAKLTRYIGLWEYLAQNAWRRHQAKSARTIALSVYGSDEPRQVRRVYRGIRLMRRHYAPIASTRHEGFWVTDDPIDLENTLRWMALQAKWFTDGYEKTAAGVRTAAAALRKTPAA